MPEKIQELKLKITNQEWQLLMTKENKSKEDINEITIYRKFIANFRYNVKILIKISANSMYWCNWS